MSTRILPNSMIRKSLFFLLIFGACSSDVTDDVIGQASFPDYVVNLNLPEFNDLRTKGWMYINKIGVRGVILYKVPNTLEYYAFERNCTFRPYEACSTVDVHLSGLYMEDACCGSTFNFAGIPTSPPAITPLRRYDIADGGNNTILITDNIIQ
jgi:hypothetical protein